MISTRRRQCPSPPGVCALLHALVFLAAVSLGVRLYAADIPSEAEGNRAFERANAAYHEAWDLLKDVRRNAPRLFDNADLRQTYYRCALALGWERFDSKGDKYASELESLAARYGEDLRYERADYNPQAPALRWSQEDYERLLGSFRQLRDDPAVFADSGERMLFKELNVRLLLAYGDSWKREADKYFAHAVKLLRDSRADEPIGRQERRNILKKIVALYWKQSRYQRALQVVEGEDVTALAPIAHAQLLCCAEFALPPEHPFRENLRSLVAAQAGKAALPAIRARPWLQLQTADSMVVAGALESGSLISDAPPRERALQAHFAGVFFWAADQYEKAIAMFTAAGSDPADLDISRQALAYSGMLNCEFNALQAAEAAFALLEKRGANANDLPARREALMGLGLVELHRGDLAGARKCFESAAEGLSEDTAESRRLLVVANINMGNILFRQKRYKEALARQQQALSQLHASLDEAKCLKAVILGNMGEVKAGLPSSGDFRIPFQEAVRLARELQYPELEAGLLDMWARTEESLPADLRAEEKLDRRRRALDLYRQALGPIARMRMGLRDLRLKVSFFENKMSPFEGAVRLAFDLAASPHASEQLAAFETAEKAKAQAFLDLLRQHGIAPASSNPSGGRAASLERRAASARSSSECLDVQGVRKRLLDDHTVLLEYFAGNDDLYVWAVAARHVEALRCRSAVSDVRRLVAEFRAYQEAIITRDYARLNHRKEIESCYALYGILFPKPVRDLLERTGARRLIIVPHEILHELPFEALPTEDPRTGRPAYLIEHFDIGYAPSATVLHGLKERKQASDFVDFAARAALIGFLGDMLFPDRIVAAAKQCYEEHNLPPVKTEQEVGLIVRLWGESKVDAYMDGLSGRAPTKPRLLRAMAQPAPFIHIGTHGGFLDKDNRQDFALYVSKEPSDPRDDGLVRFEDIMKLRLRTDLVVLAACESGLGEVRTYKGEGLVGASRAFLQAGASSVIVSLWSVGDVTTAFLLENFYCHLRRGMDPCRALSEAKRSMIRTPMLNFPMSIHAHYWSPFIFIGVSGS